MFNAPAAPDPKATAINEKIASAKLIFADELIKFLLNILLSILIGLIAATLGIFIGKNI